MTQRERLDLEHGAHVWRRVREQQGPVRVPLHENRNPGLVLRGLRAAEERDPLFWAEWMTERDHVLELVLPSDA